jgi:DNA-binding LytR/AlgR family response regulator
VSEARKLVSVVDDDESVRESLPDLLKQFGFAARAFASAEEFLASDCLEDTRCLLLDIALPAMSGPELQHDSGHFHHRSPRRECSSSPPQAGRHRVPVQAIQRPGSAGSDSSGGDVTDE